MIHRCHQLPDPSLCTEARVGLAFGALVLGLLAWSLYVEWAWERSL